MGNNTFKLGIAATTLIAFMLGYTGYTIWRDERVRKATDYLTDKDRIYRTVEKGDTPWGHYTGETIPSDAPPALWAAYRQWVGQLKEGDRKSFPDIDDNSNVGPNANKVGNEGRKRYLDDLADGEAGKIASILKEGIDIYSNPTKQYRERAKTAYANFENVYSQAKSMANKAHGKERDEYLKLEVFAGMHQALVLKNAGDNRNTSVNLREALTIYQEILGIRKELTTRLGRVLELDTHPLRGYPVATIETIEGRIAECKLGLKKINKYK